MVALAASNLTFKKKSSEDVSEILESSRISRDVEVRLGVESLSEIIKCTEPSVTMLSSVVSTVVVGVYKRALMILI